MARERGWGRTGQLVYPALRRRRKRAEMTEGMPFQRSTVDLQVSAPAKARRGQVSTLSGQQAEKKDARS